MRGGKGRDKTEGTHHYTHEKNSNLYKFTVQLHEICDNTHSMIFN